MRRTPGPQSQEKEGHNRGWHDHTQSKTQKKENSTEVGSVSEFWEKRRVVDHNKGSPAAQPCGKKTRSKNGPSKRSSAEQGQAAEQPPRLARRRQVQTIKKGVLHKEEGNNEKKSKKNSI